MFFNMNYCLITIIVLKTFFKHKKGWNICGKSMVNTTKSLEEIENFPNYYDFPCIFSTQLLLGKNKQNS